MNELLPGLYDHIEPVALRIARRAAGLSPADALAGTLRWLRTRLNPGGALILGEGSHYSADLPSPVSLVLALFDGWWNVPTSPARPQPGFLLAEHWLAAFSAAGFERASMESWSDGRRTFGGVYWAFGS